jgi:hypothetical protein
MRMTAIDATKAHLHRRMILAATVALIGLVGSTKALASPVDLEVVDRDTGQPLRTWRHDRRLFVAGEPGNRYGLRVVNNTDGRVLAVMSVDGVNIITGETAAYDQRGYVLSPHQSYEMTGWRKSDTEVAAFTFAPLSQSYAARTGRPADVGVIGVAIFREKVAPAPTVAPPYAGPNWREGSSRRYSGVTALNRSAAGSPSAGFEAPAPASPASQAPAARASAGQADESVRDRSKFGVFSIPDTERLGTAHGAREWSVTYCVPFERATSYPQWIEQVDYDTRDHLIASGVIPADGYEGHRPRPFPSSPGGANYVPDPPGDP